MPLLHPDHRLWIERVSDRLGISVWVGSLIFFVLLLLLFAVIHFAVGAWGYFVSQQIFQLAFLIPFEAFFLLGAVYIRRRVSSLEKYADSIVVDTEYATDKIAQLSSWWPLLVIWIILDIVLSFRYVSGPPEGLTQFQNLVMQPVWFLGLLAVATCLWAWGYSMVGIYRIGKLPLKLVPFAKDRTLGLKPFASASLRLSGFYYLFILILILQDLSFQSLPLFVLVRETSLVILGLILFFLPLLSLHRKLSEKKSEEMEWIIERYVRIIERMKSVGDAPLDQDMQGELMSIDKVQRDIHSIRTWPIDTGAMAKVATIFLSVTAILLSKVLSQYLKI